LNFEESEIIGASLISFNLVDGPYLKWYKKLNGGSDVVKLDDFAMNFYLSFRGGNSGKKPRAILYDNFYIVAFPRDLELCCLFMKPQGIEANISKLNKIASHIMLEMDDDEGDETCTDENDGENSDEDTVEEIKRLILNMLNDTKMSTPEMRRYFKLTNSQIWKIMSDLESSKKVVRAGKKGRAQLWTVP